MISCPAAKQMADVKPSIATDIPSWTYSAIASLRDRRLSVTCFSLSQWGEQAYENESLVSLFSALLRLLSPSPLLPLLPLLLAALLPLGKDLSALSIQRLHRQGGNLGCCSHQPLRGDGELLREHLQKCSPLAGRTCSRRFQATAHWGLGSRSNP